MKRKIYTLITLLFAATLCDSAYAGMELEMYSRECSKEISLASHSNDSEEVDEELKHVEVGSRAIQHSDSVEEQSQLCMEKDAENSDEGEELISRGSYYNSHNHAYHRAVGVSYYGNEVTLEDGSIWTIASFDQWKTLNWLSTDTILIMQNKWLFSSNKFMLVNQNTGKEVEANLSLGPYYSGAYTHWIISVDDFNKVITLDDGSVWEMNFFDSLTINQWLVNDTVIIGINQSGFAASPNILINVNMLNYARGICLN